MAPQIDVGVNVNTRCPVIYPEFYPAPRMVDLGEELERRGYDTVFVGDNYFSKPRLESTTTLAAIAGRTRRIKLATSALIAPLRNTVWLALGWSTIDLIANGRTILVACVGGGSAEAGGPEVTPEVDRAGGADAPRSPGSSTWPGCRTPDGARSWRSRSRCSAGSGRSRGRPSRASFTTWRTSRSAPSPPSPAALRSGSPTTRRSSPSSPRWSSA